MGEAFQRLVSGLGALVSRAVQPLARQARLSLSTLLLDGKGSPMLEAIVGITIFAVVGAAVLGGVSTTRRTGAAIERQGVAETIARNQIENLFSQPYRPPGTSYATSTSSVVLPPGFNVTLTTQEVVVSDTNVEKIIVTVTHEGKTVLTVETMRSRPEG